MTSSREDTLHQAAVVSSLRAIWERRKEGVLAQVELVERATLSLIEGDLTDELRGQALSAAHRLAGSVGTFGFAEASRLARQIEHELDGERDLGPSEVLRLSELVVRLRPELERGLPTTPPAPASTPDVKAGSDDGGDHGDVDGGGPLLLVVAADTGLAEQLTLDAAAAGLRAAVLGSTSDAAPADLAPDAILLDLRGLPGVGGDLRGLGELRRRWPAVPSLVLTDDTGFAHRVEAARWGATRFLHAGLRPAQIIEAALDVIARADDTISVLALDDDPVIGDMLTAVLAVPGVRLRTLVEPSRLFDALLEHRPDLLLLDFDLPGATGAELCHAVRSDPRWRTLPVVFLTAQTDPETVRRVFQAGADDFLAKPIVGAELLSRMANRFERIQVLRQLADTDPLTGLANRRQSLEQLEHLQAAGRFQEPFCLAAFDIDSFKVVNDRFGHAAGDRVLRGLGDLLRRTFRSEDVTARWGGDEFVVGMYGVELADAVRRLGRMMETFRRESFLGDGGERFTVTFSAGVAEYPADGGDLSALCRSTDDRLYVAKSEGHDRITAADAGSAVSEKTTVDVVLVEDDEALAELVLHALNTRGYSTHWFRDGGEAAAALTTSVAATVVLLDWDLPELNGLGVLKTLADAGVLARTRVIMLTGRSSEAEILESLGLGAADHVSKPFSVPVLMHRVHRSLVS